MALLPRTPAPKLSFETVSGPHFELASQTPKAFTLVIVYRGLHCGICKLYLQKMEALYDDFKALGVEAFAVSSDTPAKAAQAVQDWGLSKLPVGHSLDFAYAKMWQLFISNARKEGEAETFFEPGLFLVDADGNLFFASVGNMPYGRPDLEEMLRWTEKVLQNDIPARGEVDVSQY